MDPIIGGAIAGGVLNTVGGFLGNKASADEAKRNRQFQRRMYRHRYQYTVEDMRRAGLNPSLAYQQGGGSAPSGSMASQDNPLADTGEGVTRAMSSALGVQQVRAQIAQTKAQTDLTTAQTEQLRKESQPRADWWGGRLGELTQRVGLMGHQAEVASNTANFLADTFRDRRQIAGLQREELEQILKQLKLEIDLRGLDRAPLEVQAQFARSWFGKNVAPAVGTAGGVAGALMGIVAPFLRFMDDRRPSVTTEETRTYKGWKHMTRRSQR